MGNHLTPVTTSRSMAGHGGLPAEFGRARLRLPGIGDGEDDFPGHADAAGDLVSGVWWVTSQKNGVTALGLQRVLGSAVGSGSISCAGLRLASEITE